MQSSIVTRSSRIAAMRGVVVAKNRELRSSVVVARPAAVRTQPRSRAASLTVEFESVVIRGTRFAANAAKEPRGPFRP